MSEEIVLTEKILTTCFNCGEQMKPKGMYDYYCSKKCENEDQERITKGIEEGKHPTEILFEALKKQGAEKK